VNISAPAAHAPAPQSSPGRRSNIGMASAEAEDGPPAGGVMCFACAEQLSMEEHSACKKQKLGNGNWLHLCVKDLPAYRAAARDWQAQGRSKEEWNELHTEARRPELQVALVKIRQMDPGKSGRKRPKYEWGQLMEVKKSHKERKVGKKAACHNIR
jgi:hypothetical protein